MFFMQLSMPCWEQGSFLAKLRKAGFHLWSDRAQRNIAAPWIPGTRIKKKIELCFVYAEWKFYLAEHACKTSCGNAFFNGAQIVVNNNLHNHAESLRQRSDQKENKNADRTYGWYHAEQQLLKKEAENADNQL